jgi:membrane peptidoglycan carboxypeptidase
LTDPGGRFGQTLEPAVKKRSVKFGILIAILLPLIALAVFVADELRTSRLQAHYLARLGQELSFRVEPGVSRSIRFPQSGPYDFRLGYAQLPDYLQRLSEREYAVTGQARLSPRLAELVDRGLYLPYQEKNRSGLEIRDCKGAPIYAAAYPERIYPDFEAAPSLLVDSLLHIENHTLLDPGQPRRNPAIEWGRFGRALGERAMHLFDSSAASPGGSTLATQIEKYRHSPDGLTTSGREKLRQMASASVRSYLNGEDTSATRRQLLVDYLNTVPLSARAGFGEINGIGDGLWAWYGRDFKQVNDLLADNSQAPLAARALAYKEALSLLIAERSPSYYLVHGDELGVLTDAYLRVMTNAGVISPALRDVALTQSLRRQIESVRPPPPPPPIERKGVNAVRSNLSSLLGVPRMYDLDRLDLRVDSALDSRLQQEITAELLKLRNPAHAKTAGLIDYQLLQHGDPGRLTYSFTLFERTPGGNRVRVQADNLDQALDINKGIKLDLGSTAKLRTLITYLEIVADLHRQYAGLDPAGLGHIKTAAQDPIRRWALAYLAQAPERSLPAMLEASVEREYSGSAGESFFTGGGVQQFENFEKFENYRNYTVRDGLRYSVNLVYVRLMRDIVHFYMYQSPGSSAQLLEDSDDPNRKQYLQRFADREGRVFLGLFYRKYHGKSVQDAEQALIDGIRPTPKRLAAIFRTIAPEAGRAQFAGFIKTYLPASDLDEDTLTMLYNNYSPQRFDLPDRGYLAGVHPLELWVVGYLRMHPNVTLTQIVEASKAERQEVYKWLFKTRHKNAQDKRIRQLMEVEGFQEIHKAWKRLGYPFDSLVPSYGTAIGASADRPDALAELMGIIQNDGVRLPTVRIERLHFAAGTPYETALARAVAPGERVLAPEIPRLVRTMLADVVQAGTARRLAGVFTLPDGTPIPVGGKTGTGDNRFKTFARGGGVVSERVVSRAGAFVFYIGDRYFGTVVAYVAGPTAAEYKFTSALTVQILKVLAPTLMRRLDPRQSECGRADDKMAGGG